MYARNSMDMVTQVTKNMTMQTTRSIAVQDRTKRVSLPGLRIWERVPAQWIRLGRWLVIPAVAIGCMAWQQSYTTQLGEQVNKEQDLLVELKQENLQLNLEVGYLKAPNRIQDIAVKQLGMQLPNSFLYSSEAAKE